MSEDLINRVVELLKAADVKEEEYKPLGPGKKAIIHDKILKMIQKKVEKRYRPKLTAYNIDYVKREARDTDYGKIELAIEIDRDPYYVEDSILKLLDIRADNRVWILVPDKELLEWYGKTEKELFESCAEKIQELIESRGEKDICITAIMKRPNKFEMKEIGAA